MTVQVNTLAGQKAAFEKSLSETESSLLTFRGIDGFDVYNCSVPFVLNDRCYIYGRVEKRHEWACSWVRLFEETGKDEFTLVKDSMIYQLEDPFVAMIGKEIVLGGTHVRYSRNQYTTFYDYFYRGTSLEHLRYFTTGPEGMKDIRLVELADSRGGSATSRVGVFSRPRSKKILEKYGSASVIGFIAIPDIDSLDEQVIAEAKIIPGLFADGEWGGCNQCYMLESGYIGIIGHKSFKSQAVDGAPISVYMNVSFVFDPENNRVLDEKILATRSSYPAAPAKAPKLIDCAFPSGIVMRGDGRADLYSGLGDTTEGKVIIDYPFEGFGRCISP